MARQRAIKAILRPFLASFSAIWFTPEGCKRIWRAADNFALLLFAPGSVIGIGRMSLWNPAATNFIYASPAIILLGYLVRHAAPISRFTVSILDQVPRTMEEAAELAAAGWWRRIL
jgi:iron(III) transport system permease protein